MFEVSQNPPGRVDAAASGGGAEGAIDPEQSLRRTDRMGEATLESSRFAGSPTGKALHHNGG